MKLVNAAAEVRILKTVCGGDAKLSAQAFNGIGEETFFYEPTKEAWQRIRSLMRSHGEIPSWDDLCGDPSLSEPNRVLLKKDQQKPIRRATADKLSGTLRLLERYRQLRKLLEMSQEVMDSLEDESVDVDALMDQAAGHLVSARTRADAKSRIVHIGRGNNAKEVVRGMLNPKKQAMVPTGYKDFDDTNGGILMGSLFILAANTGGGKSTMAINLAHNMTMSGHDVCVVPLEMTEEQMLARLFGLRSGIDVGKISQHKLAKGEKKKVAGSYNTYSRELKGTETQLSVYAPEEDMSIEEILMYLRPFQHQVIIIDYISLLRGADDDDQAKKLGAIARYAKVFAKNNNCIVILLAQLDDKTKNIRYARAIREHANNAWFWYMPEEEQEISIIEIRQVKARNQKRFNFELVSHNATMLITNKDEKTREKTRTKAEKEASDDYFEDLDEEDEEGDEDEE